MTKSEKIKDNEKWWTIEKMIVSVMHTIDKSSFSWKDKILFYKELVYMLRGWVSIMEAVNTIKKQTTNYAVKSVTTSIAYYLNQGKSFSYAISRLPEYFDEWDASIIKTWESTGNLDVVLQELANEYTYINSIKNQYISALTYPCILIVMAIAAVLFLFASVLPGILDMFADDMSQLPAITRVLKSISDFFVAYWDTILILIWIWIICAAVMWSTDQWKKYFSLAVMNFPLIGKMTKTYYLIKWARYMKLMIGSGMDYVQTFRLLKWVLWVPAYQDMIDKVTAGLQMWKTIYASIKSEHHLIYPNVAVLLKVWEETAHLEDTMQNIIDMYQEELNNEISQFSKILEPVILIFMWVIVALVASGIFWVIFTVMENVGI